MVGFLRNAFGLGLLLWFVGYLLGMALFPFVPIFFIGWIILPIGITTTLLVLLKIIKIGGFLYPLALAIIWTAIAIALDYFFIVKILKPADGYYKLDVYLYYAFTFFLPFIAALWRKAVKYKPSKVQ